MLSGDPEFSFGGLKPGDRDHGGDVKLHLEDNIIKNGRFLKTDIRKNPAMSDFEKLTFNLL